MTKLNLQLAKKKEKGIALLFTLIMLSLLLMLAMSFALDSMFEQKAAYNSASSSSSGFMGQAQLKQVLLLMKEGQATFDANGMLYSHTTTTPTTTDIDMLKDKLPVSGVLVFDFANPNDPDKSDQAVKEVQWTYVKNAEDKIVGRTAFIVVPEDKIPLDSLVDYRVGTTAYPKHDEKDDTETRVGKYVSEINVRGAIPAVTANIASITEKLNWTTNKPIAGAGFANGLYTGSWTSFNNLFSTAGVADADRTEFENKLTLTTVKDGEAFWVDLNADKKIGSAEMYKRFDLTRGDWSTPTTSSADRTFIKDKILLTSGTTPDVAMQAWAETDADSDSSSAGLPWIACFGYTTGGIPYVIGTGAGELNSTFPTVEAHRFQIAANLKDYCDDDGAVIRPTSDVNPSIGTSAPTPNWLTQAPTYTGNEKTPYINKVGLRIEIDLQRTDVGLDTITTITTKVKPHVGLINIYGTNPGSDLKVSISGSVTTEISKDSGSFGESQIVPFSNQGLSALDVFDTTNWNVDSDGHSTLAEGTETAVFRPNITRALNTKVKVEVRVTNVTITKVVLHDTTADENGYDYVKTLTYSPPTPYFIAFPDSDNIGLKFSWFGFEVNDPRQNLNAGDWVTFTPKTMDADHAHNVLNVSCPDLEGKPNDGNGNTVDDSSLVAAKEKAKDGSDLEKVDDSGYSSTNSLSTAYIRNAPMESPWELGFIHRGAKWKTLNLKKYDKDKGFQITTTQINSQDYIPGGGLYDDGDANILDQVKMTAKSESPQKINMSSQEDATLNALFYKVKLGCDINSTMTVKSIAGFADAVEGTPASGTEINLSANYYTDSDPTKGMRQGIINWFKTPDISTFTNLTRASIANTNMLLSAKDTEPNPTISLTAGTTDAEQEELIGKIINLTKVGAQSGDFAIIVLSQTINDIGGAIGNPQITVYKVPADGSAALPVDCQIGVFDVAGSDSDWTKNAYGDEITGEQKIMVKGNNSVNGIITIKSFQYID